MINNTLYEAMRMAYQYYDEKTMQHVLRVADYVKEDRICEYFDIDEDELIAVAILHDIIEDTDVTIDMLTPFCRNIIIEAIQLLTYDKEQGSYEEYCQKIKRHFNMYEKSAQLAYLVKKADIKDHLSLQGTLTDKLKDKYCKGLAILL